MVLYSMTELATWDRTHKEIVYPFTVSSREICKLLFVKM